MCENDNIVVWVISNKCVHSCILLVGLRKILNELSAEEVMSRNDGEDDVAASSGVTVTVPTTPTIYQTSSGQYSKTCP